jgi:hypothetical protein
MNKKILWTSIPILLAILIFIVVIFVGGSGSQEKLSNYLHKEKGNINDIFHQYALEDVKLTQEKVTQVKDLQDFRRYLFFMPKVHFIATSAEEASIFEKSFPNFCEFTWSNQPKWMLRAPSLAAISGYFAVFTCRKMQLKM